MPILFKKKIYFQENTEPGPFIESAGNKQPIILWNPDQPEFGPVYHVVVNFVRLPEKKKCTMDRHCPWCKATRLYTKFLREQEAPNGQTE